MFTSNPWHYVMHPWTHVGILTVWNFGSANEIVSIKAFDYDPNSLPLAGEQNLPIKEGTEDAATWDAFYQQVIWEIPDDEFEFFRLGQGGYYEYMEEFAGESERYEFFIAPVKTFLTSWTPSNDVVEAITGYNKIMWLFGSDPDAWPDPIIDLASTPQYADLPEIHDPDAFEEVLDAVEDAVKAHKQEIKETLRDTAFDLAQEMGYKNIPAMLGAAVDTMFKALPARMLSPVKKLAAAMIPKKEMRKMLPWRK